MNKTIVLVFLASLLVFFGCQTDLDEKAFLKWVENPENGLNKTKKTAEYVYSVLYKPAAYKAILANRKIELEDLEVSDFLNFTLTLGVDKDIDFVDYHAGVNGNKQAILDYLAFSFQNDIWLETNGKKVPCALYHFERSFDLKSTRKINLGFQIEDKGIKNIKLVIAPKFNTSGKVKFSFDLTHIPKVKI